MRPGGCRRSQRRRGPRTEPWASCAVFGKVERWGGTSKGDWGEAMERGGHTKGCCSKSQAQKELHGGGSARCVVLPPGSVRSRPGLGHWTDGEGGHCQLWHEHFWRKAERASLPKVTPRARGRQGSGGAACIQLFGGALLLRGAKLQGRSWRKMWAHEKSVCERDRAFMFSC